MSLADGNAVRFVGPENVDVVGVDPPTPEPEGVVVETTCSAVSAGTELLVYHGNVDSETIVDEKLPALSGTFSYPLRYGYAAVGYVTALDDRVDSDWLGRRVFAFNPHESHFRAAPEDLHPVPEGIETERAAFFANVETAINFALDAAPRIGECVAVFGQGVVGLLTTAILSEMPIETLVAVEPLDRRRELAARLGADETIDPNARNPVEAIESVTGGVDIAIEVSGSPSTLESAVKSTRYGGRVVVGSWYGTKRESINLGDHYHRGRISIESSQVSTLAPELSGRWDKARRRATTWRRLREIDLEPLITHRYDIRAAEKAYQQLTERPEETIQVLLTY